MFSLKNLSIYALTLISLASASLSFGAFVFFWNRTETPFYTILLAAIFTAGHSVIAYGLLGVVIDIFSGVE